jgi:UDP:flavonoid glycosyltransferase YjiC (YdhE family)
VRTLIGAEGFQTNLENVIASAARQKNHEIYIIGGAKDLDFYQTAGDWYPTYVKLLEKNNIKKKLLALASFSSEFKKKFVAEKNTELKTVAEGLSSPTYTRITEEMVSIEMYEPQIIVIQIFNKIIARAYMDSFELLWKTAQVET